MWNASFHVIQPAFQALVGNASSISLLHQQRGYPFAHEAAVFLPSSNELVVTSNRYSDFSNDMHITISRVNLDPTNVTVSALHDAAISMGNGGTNYMSGALLCAQGNETATSGIFYIAADDPSAAIPIITDYYGVPFNSPNDVVVARDGAIWFTDPSIGYVQGFRTAPQLPDSVYRYHPQDDSTRAVVTDIAQPNGLAFSPDESILYVTDTSSVYSIYAYDVVTYSGQPFMTNRRLFAKPPVGSPDGIKVDIHGNVYAACGGEINVWSSGGVLIGQILVKGGTSNFGFGKDGVMYILNEHRILKAQLSIDTKGALLGI